MEAVRIDRVVSPPSGTNLAEETMLQEDRVREILARLARGEGVKRIARELGLDRNTVKRWRQLGTWRPRQSAPRPRQLKPFAAFVEGRGPEVGWNGKVVYRELQALGFTRGRGQGTPRVPSRLQCAGRGGVGRQTGCG